MPDRRSVLALIAAAPAIAFDPMRAWAQADELIARMSLEEKLGQLTILSADFTVTGPAVPGNVEADLRAGRVGSLFNLWGRDAIRRAQTVAVEETRLGIPLFFALDILHGFRTVFPIPLAEAGAFDPGLWQATARVAAAEAVAAGLDLTFAPMLDISRDPRWGRIAEGPGEDPYVGSRFAAAKVRGYQGEALEGLVATPKHFVAYGASAAGRDYAAVDISDRALAEIYLPPFRAAVDAGALAIMPAFTDLAGVPLTAHRGLLTGVLRDDWGFEGVIISDYTAVTELLKHGVAADIPEAAALALNAGVDIDMMSRAYLTGLPRALDRALVTMATIDAAVARVLLLKERLGLFADPYRRCSGPEPAPKLDRSAARDAATRSVVLLKNAGALPLPARPGPIALIGPLADARAEMLGPWAGAGRGEDAVSLLAGLRGALPDTPIEHVPGVPIQDDAAGDGAGIAAAVAAAAAADHVLLALGEAAWMSGEAASRGRLDLPGRQATLAEAVVATGKPVTLLLFSGRPLALPTLFAEADAVLACWFPGIEAGAALAAILTGAASPSAGLAVSWPAHVGQVPLAYGALPGGRPENPADKYTSKYLDLPNRPAFAFGHGLSYTSFTLSAPTATVAAGRICVEARLTNTGTRPGTTTVFLFLRDPVARVSRPMIELRRFETLTLAPAETRPVRFSLDRTDLAYPGPDLRPQVDPGVFELHLGLSAAPESLRSTQVIFD